MNEMILSLIIFQFIATAIGAYFLAREAKKLETAIAQAAGLGFILPFILYIIPYSMNPTIDKLTFFIEWLMYSWVANEIAAIPVAVITKIARG